MKETAIEAFPDLGVLLFLHETDAGPVPRPFVYERTLSQRVLIFCSLPALLLFFVLSYKPKPALQKGASFSQGVFSFQRPLPRLVHLL